MDTSFFTSALSETDYRIFDLTSKIISSGFAGYVAIGFSIYFTMELIKMMYLRQPMDLGNILIALLIASAFLVYVDLAKLFDQELNAVYSSIRKVAGNTNVALAQGTYKGTSLEQDVTSELSAYTTDEEKMDVFDEFFTGSLSSVIYTIMMGIRKTLLMFMYAIGPVCMALSMFPIFGVKVLKNWFFYLLNIHLWELGFIILQVIQSQIGFWRSVDNNSTGMPEMFSGNGWAWACYNVTNFICFGMVPYLTGKLLIGLSQPSSFAGRAMASTAIVSAGIRRRVAGGMSSGGGSRGDSASGGGGTVTSTIKNSMEAAGGNSSSSGGGGKESMYAKAGKMYGNVTKNFKTPPIS